MQLQLVLLALDQVCLVLDALEHVFASVAVQRDLLGLSVQLGLERQVLRLGDPLPQALQQLLLVQLDFSVALLDRLLWLQREGRVAQFRRESGVGDFFFLPLRLEQLFLLDLLEGVEVELVFGSSKGRLLLCLATVAEVVSSLGQFF